MNGVTKEPMPKHLRTLVTEAKTLRESHNLRHRPSGYGFALADSVNYLDTSHWDQVTQHDSIFFSRRYLQVLETAGPENLRQRYALIFHGTQPVAAVAAQLITVSLERLRKSSSRDKEAAAKSPLKAAELSDGTIRYLLWIAALLTPRPPGLLVLNEPETSLHPDLLPPLGRLIVDAATRSQVFVVTHPPKLIQSLEKRRECNLITLKKEFDETRIDNEDELDLPAWRWPTR
jgi:hypothetical protein